MGMKFAVGEPMNKIKHIFFDLDNTLWDYRRNAKIALEDLYKEYGIEEKYGLSFQAFFPVYEKINEALWEAYRNDEISKEELRIKRFTDTFHELGVEETDFVEEMEEKFLTAVSNNQHLVEGTVELLDYLKDKYSLHILTNGFAELLDKKIDASELKGRFRTITTGEEAGAAKPAAVSFETAMKKAGAATGDSIYIGDDWVADIVGATDIGMKAIFFNPLSEKHSWIEGVPVIDKLIEVKEHL